jgi:hypothetical protein
MHGNDNMNHVLCTITQPSVCSCHYRVSYDVSPVDDPSSRETCAAICFLHAKHIRVTEIHCELVMVYSQNPMNRGTVRQQCRMLRDKQMFTM